MPTPRITQNDNFMWLLGALLFLSFSSALLIQLEVPEGEKFVNFCLLITLLVGVWSMDRSDQKLLVLKAGVTLFLIGVMVADTFIFPDDRLRELQLSTAIAFMCLTIWQAWRQVMFSGPIDGNKIVGSICIYLLLGMVWAFAYMLVEILFPGSMRGFPEHNWQENMQPAFYYSMVTLTTLGYGDISPVLPLARFLAYTEAVVGIFYTTVLVASLIGVRLAEYSPGSGQQNN